MHDWSIPYTDDEACEKMVRVSGNSICELCNKSYFKHPYELRIKDWDGNPFLRQLCDGRLGKL